MASGDPLSVAQFLQNAKMEGMSVTGVPADVTIPNKPGKTVGLHVPSHKIGARMRDLLVGISRMSNGGGETRRYMMDFLGINAQKWNERRLEALRQGLIQKDKPTSRGLAFYILTDKGRAAL
jgi:hypothetical protein